MTDLVYTSERIDREDLLLLANFSINFLRNYPYCLNFYDFLLSVTLCQGAANHYAVCNGYAKRYFESNKNGVKDFDIWFFFKRKENNIFNPRWKVSRDLARTKFGRNPDETDYVGRRVDFFGRSIIFEGMGIEEAIRNWLRRGNSISPILISQKAVVGLYPNEILGKVIWVNPALT